MSEYVFQTVDIVKKYGNSTVLDKINLHVPQGSIYGLVGPNGAGKSTLLRILLSSVLPTEGYFSINGKTEPDELNKQKRQIGSIIESPTLYENMSAMDNLICRGKLLGIEDYKQKLKETLKFVGLETTGKKKVKNFSLGMRQRLALGIAMLGNPKILVLDEPTNGLDPIGIQEIRTILQKLNSEGVTVLISSHILSELSKFATHYGILYHGKLVKEVSAKEVSDISHEDIVVEFKSTTDVGTALGLFLKTVDEQDLKIVGEKCLHISNKNNKLTSTEVSKVLLENNIEFSSISMQKADFEEYFLKIVNGGR